MELIPEREDREALRDGIPRLSAPVPSREMEVCCFILQQMSFWVDGKFTGACKIYRRAAGFLHYVYACHGG